MFYSIFYLVEERGFLRHVQTFVIFSKYKSKTLLQRDVKQSELIGKPGLNPNHCSIPMEKVFFLQIFLENKRLTEFFSLIETLLSPFES
jgi:hypothetical protein